jgi:serine/threonine protein kinase
MSNDEPPRACLADFGFMAMVFDPEHPMSCSTQLEGGTLMFMSPELLVPQEFGMDKSIPTPQSDVYAFGLVIFQVCGIDHGGEHRRFVDIVQVLTGEIPFPGHGAVGSVYSVMKGARPIKPAKASTIGFSDPLWAFVQRCWDADMKLRPESREVVVQLSTATAGWHGVMPPYVKATRSEVSDTMKHREFEAMVIPRSFSSNNGTGGVFIQSSGTRFTPENTTNSGTTFSRLSHVGPPSTQFTEPPQEPQVVVQELKPWIPTGPNEEPRYPHLGKNFKPPPSLLPQRKWTNFRYLKQKFRKLFGL